MSTYLAAIYVGEFVPNKNNSYITVYTHKDYVNQTEYVSNDAPRYLRVLEEYTGIKYMLPKMDLLSIPDFSAGAMENWGMNTYRYNITSNRLIIIIIYNNRFRCSFLKQIWSNTFYGVHVFTFIKTHGIVINIINWRELNLFSSVKLLFLIYSNHIILIDINFKHFNMDKFVQKS